MIRTMFSFYGFWMDIKLIFRILKVACLWSINFVVYYLGLHYHHFCSPATIISHITQFYHLDPKFVVLLLHSLHYDDLNSGAHTIGNELEFFVKCKEGLALGFNLRKFRWNSKELENLVVEKFHEEKSNENTILGLQWDKSSRELFVTKLCKNIPTVTKKRSIIQFLESIYNPYGLINPLIVKLSFIPSYVYWKA